MLKYLLQLVAPGLIFSLAAIVAACGPSVPSTAILPTVATATDTISAPTATPPVANPSITLSPSSGGPHTRVLVTGEGFPAGQAIDIRLSAGAGAATPSLGEAVAGGDGTIQLALMMPEEWSNGTPIADRQLVVVAANADASVKATAPFNFQPFPTPTAPDLGDSTSIAALDAASTQAASQTATNFLNALEQDPSGKTSVTYLDTNLQAKVRNGQKVTALLGIQNVYPSFQINSVEPGDEPNTAFVRVTLNFDQPGQRLLTLTKQDDTWKISDIVEGQ